MARRNDLDAVSEGSHELSDVSEVEDTELQTRAPKRGRLSESSTDSYVAPEEPTAIQKACIPEILNGKDCIGGNRPGSGKGPLIVGRIL